MFYHSNSVLSHHDQTSAREILCQIGKKLLIKECMTKIQYTQDTNVLQIKTDMEADQVIFSVCSISSAHKLLLML